jgi:cysteine desulfurase/selenocysteine lyase
VHRALHTLGEEATAAFEEARGTVARFIGASDPAEVIYTRGTTEAINLVAASWGRANLGPGDVILLTEMEHHANLVPWQQLCAERGCSLRFLRVRDDGTLDLAPLEEPGSAAAAGAAPIGRLRLVALTHASNVLGTVNDVRRAAELAHAWGALVLVDAAQSAPHLPIDVGRIGCDFLAFSGHKACGPMGIGALWARRELLERMPPYQAGGEMIRSVWLDRSTWNDPPWKFEAGTPDVAGAVGMAAGLDYLSGLGLPAIAAREDELTRRCLAVLAAMPGITVHGAAPERGPVVSFSLAGIHPHDVAQVLDAEGIAVRAGHHCAQPLMRRLGVPATARASLSFINTFAEIDLLARALERCRERFA